MENQDFDLVDELRQLLGLSVKDGQQRQRAEELGLNPEKLCNGMLLVISLFDAAKNGKRIGNFFTIFSLVSATTMTPRKELKSAARKDNPNIAMITTPAAAGFDIPVKSSG